MGPVHHGRGKGAGIEPQRTFIDGPPDLFACAFLRDFSLEDLAKTGDAQKQFMVVEYTLESRNEAGSGIIADLTTS